MKDKKHLIILICSLIFLIITGNFYYKYVVNAKNIPIKKIENSRNLKKITNTQVIKIFTPDDNLNKLVESNVEINKETFEKDMKNIFNTVKLDSNYLIQNDDGNYDSFFDQNITLLNSYQVDNKLYLNLSLNIVSTIKNKKQELLLIYSLVNTYTSLHDVDKVKFLIDGREVEKLKWYNLRTFYTKNLDI